MSQTIEEKAPQVDAGGQAGPEPSLTGRVVKGAAWVFAGKLAGRGMSLVKLVVLARLLSPEDFGLFGIVMLAIAALQTFTQTGFNTALIQRKDNTEDYLDTAWTVQIIRGLVLAGLLYASAPLVGWFFEEPRAVPLLRVMCAAVAVSGFVNIGTIYFRKELQFHKQVLWDTASSFVGLVVGVVLAYQLRSVWALVWAGLAAAPVRVILSYAIHPYRPRPGLDYAQAGQLFAFGKWVLGTSVVVFLATHGDDAFLGKIAGAVALGLYQIAYRISNAPATEVTHLANAVMMPAYAKLQSDRRRLGRAFLDVFEVVVTLALPLTAFIIFAAPQIVLGLLGPKWADAILPAQILALAGFIRAVAATGGPLFVGSGRPHMDFWMNLGRVSIIALAIYPLTVFWGVAGTSAAIVLGLAGTLPVWASVVRITGVQWRDVLGRCRHALALGALTAVAIWFARIAMAGLPLIAVLVSQVAAAGTLVAGWVLANHLLLRSGPSLPILRAWKAVRPACLTR